MSFFDYIQTFYVNPDAVNGALEINLSSIELYFKAKPTPLSNVSGIRNPGISAWICEVSNNQPEPTKIVGKKLSYVEYDSINTSGNALSGTVVSFPDTVPLKAGKFYGMVVKFDDPGYTIWLNKQGDRLVNQAGPTNNPSSGSQNRFDGTLYKASNSNAYLAFSDRDLKFKVNIAQYISTSASFNVSNKSYEFFTIGSPTGSFRGGEYVWQSSSNEPGTIAISSSSANVIGVGTTFTTHIAGQYIVLSQNNVSDVVKIKNVANATFLELDSFPAFSNTATNYIAPPLAKVYYTDYTANQLFLVDSNAANATFKFTANNRVYGEISKATANVVSIDRYKIDTFVPKFTVSNPSSSQYTLQYALANSTNSISAFDNLETLKENKTKTESYILSRSQEVVEAGLYGTAKKSAVINIAFNVIVSNTNLFTAPKIDSGELDIYIYQNDINDYASTLETRYGILNFDTEIEKNGLARSKAPLKKVEFAQDRPAEDLRVYLSAYKPAGTDIKIYAKIHNSADKETFDDKQWTPLELKDNIDRFSNENADIIEYTYGLPQYPETYENLTGEFTTISGNNVVQAVVDPSASVIAGDLVKIYNPLLPDNHEVFVVASSNSTSISVNKDISNLNIVGSVYVDRIKYKGTAWNNIANDDISRYVNSASAEFDTFNTMQLKIVFYSDNSYSVPKVEQIQAIGVSA